MSKYLFLCRHADTHSSVGFASDFSRKLTATGLAEARQAGTWIQNFNLPVDFILHSAAVRTTQTAIVLADCLRYKPEEIISSADLYNTTARKLLQVITQISQEKQVAVIVGHNPSVSDVAASINHQHRQYVPTAGVNFFTFHTNNWQELEWCDCSLQTNY